MKISCKWGIYIRNIICEKKQLNRASSGNTEGILDLYRAFHFALIF